MFRSTARLFQAANKDAKLLDLLLPACKDLESASQELKWIQNELPKQQWLNACTQRSNLVPLQYIIGTQPFGGLEIKCRKNVLIPRWETEEWTLLLTRSIKRFKQLKVLDVCTGTGCIPLLMASFIKDGQFKGIDISQDAIGLAEENKTQLGISNVAFQKGDVFDKNVIDDEKFDLIIANPPYISEESYQSGDTEESVRLFEPRLALVGGLEFYSALVKNVVNPSGAEGFIFELDNLDQAQETINNLGVGWSAATMNDSNGKLRCVFGFRTQSQMQVLQEMRNFSKL